MAPSLPADTTFALLADIHANRWALEAVLADIARRHIRTIYNLGDVLYGPLDPAGTYELLKPLNLPTVRGNMDRYLTEVLQGTPDSPIPRTNPTMKFVVEELDDSARQFLAGLPFSLAAGTVQLFHGNTTSDEQPLVEHITAAGVKLFEGQDIAKTLALAADTAVVGCAHTHLPRVTYLPGRGTVVVNPGSVGLPAYADDAPFPHKMESGSPHAKYTVLTLEAGVLVRIEQVAVRYDWQAAAQAARRLGRLDWAQALLTGFAG